MTRITSVVLFLWLFCMSIGLMASSVYTGSKIRHLQDLVEHGDYEEALRVGQLIAEKNKDKDTSTYIVTNCLLSKAAYHWYDFKLSETFFSIALDEWSKSNLSAKNKFIVGLYISDLALEENDPTKANELANSLVLVKGIDFWYGYWFWTLKSRIELAKGNYSQALSHISFSAGALSNLRMEMGDKLGAEAEHRMLCIRGEILVASGDWEGAASTLQEIKDLSQKSHLASPENNFYRDRLKGLLSFAKSDFSDAHQSFLNAFNDLEANDQEYRKYEALKYAAFSASKAGMLTDVHQLLRRAEMLAMKDASAAHIFGPGQASIRIWETIESNQFGEASSKTKSAFRKYNYLPDYHPIRFEYLNLQSLSNEAGGDLKSYRMALDSLASATIRKYGIHSFKYDEVKLQIAEYEWKYGGDFKAALSLYQEHYNSGLRSNLYKFSPGHLRWLEGYIHVFEYLDQFDSALVKASLASEISEKSLGINSPDANYFKSLTALHLFNVGKYKESVDKLMSAYDANKKISDNANGYLAKACYLQASLFEWNGEFSFINKQIQKATKLMLSKEDNKYFEKVEGLEELGIAYTAKNNFYKAERNFVETIGIVRKNSGSESFMLIDPLLSAADLKIQKGDIKEAENYLTEAEKLIQKYFPAQSSRQIKFLELQSNYYKAVSDEKQAMDLIVGSIEKTENLYSAKHVRLANLLAEKAHLSILGNNSQMADETYESAKKIIEDGLGRQSPAYASLQVQQAELYVQINDFEKASNNLSEAEKYWVNKLGAVNVFVASISHIRGELSYKQKKYNDAGKYFNKAALQYADLYNKKHSGYLKAGLGLAKVAYMQGELKDAADILERILDERIQFTVNNFSIMTFSQKSSIWSDFREEFELYSSIVYKLNLEKRDSKRLANLYDYTIRTKGLLMNSDAQVRRQVYQSGDSALVVTFNEWLFEKEFFALISYYSPSQLAEEKISLENVQKTIEELEKKINSKTENGIAQSNKDLHWTDVRNALARDESAVEMVKFRYFNQVFTDTVVYMALVLDAKAIEGPKEVVIVNGKNLEGKNLRYYRNTAISKSEDEMSYNAYLKDIKSVIPDGNTIYFSGEGVFTQINPEMMYNPENKKYALETNTFVFVTNTKDIVSDVNRKVQAKSKETQQYYLYGNPQFYTSTPKDGKESIPSLFGAEREILDINEVLKKEGKSVTNLIGKEVTEDTVRALQNPSVFHISTHGFFMEKKNDNLAMGSNPMLNSGLLLSGSGNILSDKKSGYINQTPGILTASEVIDLNFTKTNLVILSACETGRGQVEVGEGVYGLQRAFLVAGAKAIVLSLFKVDDAATRLLMSKFYDKFLHNGGDFRKAFREAKQELRNSENFKSPIYWGAFIMIEGHPSRRVVN